MTTDLTFIHLRIQAIAQSNIQLAYHYAGNNLRNAMASVMLRANCPETHRREKPTPEHAASCPACWLLAAEVDPGRVMRVYALAPPLPPRYSLRPGDHFCFGLTLFGEGDSFLPYFVLALNEVGRIGFGPGRGTFALQAIDAIDPLRGVTEPVLLPGDSVVHVPRLRVGWDSLPAGVDTPINGELTLSFLTPLRLEEDNRLFRSPDFGVFFHRLLFRIDDLGRQLAGEERRPPGEVEGLHAMADKVRMVSCDVQWNELASSTRRKGAGQKTYLSGLTGRATYCATDWSLLLPWLLLGQGVQAGQLTSKGNGVYEVESPTNVSYWWWLNNPNP